ncbi:hypothetical protein BC332_13938 [Capsicum chinense]|nr:hypothetical protein BC332_13938 [Capsicum chinense]
MVKSDNKVVELAKGCKTPTHDKCRIKVNFMCPPPTPRKKRMYNVKSAPPKEGYFEVPDIEVFLALYKPRR